MREAGKPATLNELLGGQGSEVMSLKDLNKLLGEKMPDLPRNRIGKYRLVNALAQRFGPEYRNLPNVVNILKEFDQEMETENVIRMNKKGV